MFTERNAIEDQLRHINNEMMDLRQERTSLIKRLREIDERDMKSNSIDLMENLSDKLLDAVGEITKILPRVSAPDMIKYLQEEGTIKAEQVESSEEKEQEPTEVEKAAQEQLLHMKPKRLSIEESAAVIKNIITEQGEGKIVSSQIIEHEFYERTGLKYTAFSPKMTEAMELFPSIKRVSRGKFKIERETKKENLSLVDIAKQQQEEQLIQA